VRWPAGRRPIRMERHFSRSSPVSGQVPNGPRRASSPRTAGRSTRPGRVGTFSASQRQHSALGADDRIVALVAAVLAVASGTAALYLKTPAWGGAGDYIAACCGGRWRPKASSSSSMWLGNAGLSRA